MRSLNFFWMMVALMLVTALSAPDSNRKGRGSKAFPSMPDTALAGGPEKEVVEAAPPTELPPPVPNPNEPGSWAVAERGADHAIWENVRILENEEGEELSVTNRYMQLETGLHARSANGEWTEAVAGFQIANGRAVAEGTRFKLRLDPDFHAGGQVELVTPDGTTIRSRVFGIAYFDESTGESVLIAELKEAQGEIINPTQVLYADAFTDFEADILYTQSKSGFEQDVILREAPPSPQEFGFNPATTRLEVWTEFLEGANPGKRSEMISASKNGGVEKTSLQDQRLNFGTMEMGSGKAFSRDDGRRSVPVGKSWEEIDGNRRFLIEAVRIEWMSSELEKLPLSPPSALRKPIKSRRELVAAKGASKRPKEEKTAMGFRQPARTVALKANGYVIDYPMELVSSGPPNNIFKSDVTYYVTGTVNLNSTPVTFEAGTVIKMGVLGKLNVTCPIVWEGEKYRPVILTVKDDNSVGEVVAGATGTPGAPVGEGIVYSANAGAPLVIEHGRFSHIHSPISIGGGKGHMIRHAQFVNCAKALVLLSSTVDLSNVLIANTTTAFYRENDDCSLRAEHLTIAGSPTVLGQAATVTAGPWITFYNTIIAMPPVGNAPSYASAAQGVIQLTLAEEPFETAFGGGYYLKATSRAKGGGRPLLTSPTLKAELKELTTEVPVEVKADFTSTQMLVPRADRATTGEDPGYHYYPVDYLVNNKSVASGTLTITNGTVIAVTGATGLKINNSAILVSDSTPEKPNRFVAYQTVQESGMASGSRTPTLLTFNASTSSSRPTGRLRFTDFVTVGAVTAGLYALVDTFSSIDAVDSQFRGTMLWCAGNGAPLSPTYPNTLTVKNSVFERGSLKVSRYLYNKNTPLSITVFNNLFWRSLVEFWTEYPTAGSPPAWVVRENVFDDTSPVLQQYGNSISTFSYNGYVNGATVFSGETGPTSVASFTYAMGPLGRWYHGSSSFADKGRTATSAGMIHHTARVDQQREGGFLVPGQPFVNSAMDLGFHYPATKTRHESQMEFGSVQGAVWQYRYSTAAEGSPTETLSYFAGEAKWKTTSGASWGITASTLHGGPGSDVALRFTAPKKGRVNVTGAIRVLGNSCGQDGIRYRVRYVPAVSPSTPAEIIPWSDLAFQPSGQRRSFVLDVEAGDALEFQTSSKVFSSCDVVEWVPAVYYLDVHDSDGEGSLDIVEDAVGDNVRTGAETLYAMADTDGDGRSDYDEQYIDLTNPNARSSVKGTLLGYWKFNGNLEGTEGAIQQPAGTASTVTFEQKSFEFAMAGANAYEAPAVGLLFSETNDRELAYREFRTDGKPNVAQNTGSIAIWFKPQWSSGVAPLIPAQNPTEHRIFRLEDPNGEYWALNFNSTGNTLSFVTKTVSGSPTTRVQKTNLKLEQGRWYHIALTYSPTEISIYFNGSLAGKATGANAAALTGWPTVQTTTRQLAIGGVLRRVGGSITQLTLAHGAFDELKSWNYPLLAEEIHRDYVAPRFRDTDGDGLTDEQEIRLGFKPFKSDSDDDLVPDGWEYANGTNPLVGDGQADPDNDGIWNKQEFERGLKPLVADGPRFGSPAPAYDSATIINVDFGDGLAPTGPAAIGNTGDFWNRYASTDGPTIPLKNALGTSTLTAMRVQFGPIEARQINEDGCAPSYVINPFCLLDYYSGIAGAFCCGSEPYLMATENWWWTKGECWIHATGGWSWVTGCPAPCAWSDFPIFGWSPRFLHEPGTWTVSPLHESSPNTAEAIYQEKGLEVINPLQSLPGQHYWKAGRVLNHREKELIKSPEQHEYTTSWQSAFDTASEFSQTGLPSGSIGTHAMFKTYLRSRWDRDVYKLPQREECGEPWFSHLGTAEVSIGPVEDGATYELLLYGSRSALPEDGGVITITEEKADGQGPEVTAHQTTLMIANAPRKVLINGIDEITIPAGNPQDKQFAEGANFARILVSPKDGTIHVKFRDQDSVLNGLQLRRIKTGSVAIYDPIAINVTARQIDEAVVVYWDAPLAPPSVPPYLVGGTSTDFYEVHRWEINSSTSLPVKSVVVGTTVAHSFIDRTAETGKIYRYEIVEVKIIGRRIHSKLSNQISVAYVGGDKNYPPFLNHLGVLKQAFKNTPFSIGAATLTASGEVFDVEQSPITYVITKVLSGKVERIKAGVTTEITESFILANPTELTIGGGATIVWTPPLNQTGPAIDAFEVRAFAGSDYSTDAKIVRVSVKEPTMALWWGDISMGLSGGGIAHEGIHGHFTVEEEDRVRASTKAFESEPGPVLKEGSPATPLMNLQFIKSDVTTAGALTGDGKVMVWGDGRSGIGDDISYLPDEGTAGSIRWLPYNRKFAREVSMPRAQDLAVGWMHFLACTVDGNVYGWGAGGNGQLGSIPLTTYSMYEYLEDGRPLYATVASANKPTLLPGLSDIIKVAAGGAGSVALRSDGVVFTWGTAAGLTHAEPIRRFIPQRVEEIASGTDHYLALTTDGEVYTWGYNHYGQLGYSTVSDDEPASTVMRIQPGKIPNLVRVKAIAADHNHSLAVLGDGRVMEWGAVPIGAPTETPRLVEGLVNIVSVESSSETAFAVDDTGGLFAWGSNQWGKGGKPYESQNAATEIIYPPQMIDTLSGVESVAAGSFNSFAVAAIQNVAPSGLWAESSPTKINLSWRSFPRSTSYSVKRGTSGNGPFVTIARISRDEDQGTQNYADVNIVAGQVYYYVVSAMVNGAETPNSQPLSVKALPVPAAPVLDSPGIAKSRAVKFTWNKVANAEAYELYRKDPGSTEFVFITRFSKYAVDNKIEFFEVGLGTEAYSYKVKAVNSSGESSFSNTLTIDPYAPNQIQSPGTPVWISPAEAALQVGHQFVKLTWEPISAYVGNPAYLIKQRLAGSGEFKVVGRTTETSFMATKVENGQLYEFVVAAIDDNGEGASSTMRSGRPVYPGLPLNYVVMERGDGPQSLYIKIKGEAFNYGFKVMPQNGGSDPCPTESQVWPDEEGFAQFWATGLTAGTTYKVRITQVFENYAQSSSEAKYELDFNPTAAAASPVPALALVEGDNRIDIRWHGANPDADKVAFEKWRFLVLRTETQPTAGHCPGNDWVEVAETPMLGISDRTVKNGTRYWYRVIAISPSFEVYRHDGPAGGHVPQPAFSLPLVLTGTAHRSANMLTWNSVAPSASGYVIEFGRDELFVPLWTNSLTETTFSHLHLENGEEYHYRVTAYAANGDTLESNTLEIVPDALGSLIAASGFSGRFADGTLQVEWKDVPGASRYLVSKPGSPSFVLWKKVSMAQLEDALGQSAYRYRIQAIAGTLNPSSPSDITVAPLEWGTISGATSFKVERNEASVWVEIARTVERRYVDVRIEATQTTPTYRITGLNAAGGSVGTATPTAPTLTSPGVVPPASVFTIPTSTKATVELVGFSSSSSSPTIITTPTNLVLRANASMDNSQADVSRVEFYANGLLIGSTSDHPYTLNWVNPAGSVYDANGVEQPKVYQLKARLVDTKGRTLDSTGTKYISVRGALELSSFTTGATDVSVSTAGLPLTFGRSYDSARTTSGMLGIGWENEWEQTRLLVPDLAQGWVTRREFLRSYGPSFDETYSHLIELRLPGGAVTTFSPYTEGDVRRPADVDFERPGGDYMIGVFVTFAANEPGAGTLEDAETDPILAVGNIPVDTTTEVSLQNETSSGPYAPAGLKYRTLDGVTYSFAYLRPYGADPTLREFYLQKINDRFGNTLEYELNGEGKLWKISQYNRLDENWVKRTITFEYSNEGGFDCIRVYDPAAETATYRQAVIIYKLQGGLLREVHELLRRNEASPTYAATKYGYVNNRLTTVTAADGVMILENSYTAEGKLHWQSDSRGIKRTRVFSTPSGTTETQVESSWSVGSESYSEQAVYNRNGELTTVRNAQTEATYLGYDEEGRLAFTSNGGETHVGYEYNRENQMTAVSDELGNTKSIDYEADGQVRRTVEADESETRVEYYRYADPEPELSRANPHGLVSAVLDPMGNETRYEYNKRGQVTVEKKRVPFTENDWVKTQDNIYNELTGELLTSREALWTQGNLYTTQFSYDANGNSTLVKRFRTARSAPTSESTIEQRIETVSIYDPKNRVATNIVRSITGANTTPDPVQEETIHEFDSRGRQKASIDALKRRTANVFNAHGEVVEVQFADDTVTRTVYNDLGQAVWRQERVKPVGAQTIAPGTNYEYDKANRLTRTRRYESITLNRVAMTGVLPGSPITSPQTQYRVLAAGGPAQENVVFVTSSGLKEVSATKYDSQGRVEMTMNAQGGVTGYEYDAAGRRVKLKQFTAFAGVPDAPTVVWPGGGEPAEVTTHGYDALGRTSWTLDATRQSGSSDPSTIEHQEKRISFEYDRNGQQVLIRHPKVSGEATQKVSRSGYDFMSRKVLEIDEAGIQTAFGYDGLGRLLTVINNFQGQPLTTQYGYDELGQVIEQKDAAHSTTVPRKTSYEYDAFGRRTHRFLPSATTKIESGNASLEKTVYETYVIPGKTYSGRKVTVKDFRGLNLLTEYNEREQVAKKVLPAVGALPARTYTYNYDANTTLLKEILETGGDNRAEYFAYDGLRRLTRKDAPEGVLSYSREAAGIAGIKAYRKSLVPLPTTDISALTPDYDVAYTYDRHGKLATVKDNKAPAPNVSSYGYYANGSLQSVGYPGGISHAYAYTEQNRLKEVAVWSSYTLKRRFTYGLRADGLRGTVLEQTASGGGGEQYRRFVEYSYDVNNVAGGSAIPRVKRLTNEKLYAYAGGWVNVSDIRYTHDAVGNRLSRTRTGSLVPVDGISNQSLQYDQVDRVDGDGIKTNPNGDYDANGNTVTRSGATDQYDAENRLSKRGTTISVFYDESGNRVRRIASGVTTYYLVDEQNPSGYAQVIAEFTSTSSAPAKSYVYGHDLISLRVSNEANNPLYYGYDGLGSVRVLLNSDGSDREYYDYDAFGNLVAKSSFGISTNTYLFAGEQYDTALGMYYLRARYSHQNEGRFWSMDTFEGSRGEPASLHKYLYCHGDPVNGTDPSGLAVEYDAGKGLQAHALFYMFCVSQGIPKFFDTPVVTVYPSLRGEAGSRLRPDVNDVRGGKKEWFELKPVTHKNSPHLWEQTKTQLSNYSHILSKVGVKPGNQRNLVPEKVAIGIVYGEGNTYVCWLYAAEPQREGLIYYALEDLPQNEWEKLSMSVPAFANAAAKATMKISGRAAIAARGAAAAFRTTGMLIGSRLGLAPITKL